MIISILVYVHFIRTNMCSNSLFSALDITFRKFVCTVYVAIHYALMLFKSNFVEENTTKGTVYIISFKRKVYDRKFNDQLTKIK